MVILNKREAEGNPTLKRIRNILSDIFLHPVFTYVMLALAGIGVGLVSLLLGSTVFGLSLFWMYFSSPLVILLNLLPPVLVIYLLYFISGRAWIAFTFPAFLTILLSLIHFFKVQIRGDPFIVSDIMLLREASAIIAPYTVTMNWKIYFSVIVFIGGVLVSVFFLKYKLKKRALFRIIASVIVIAISAVLYATVYTNSDIYAKTTGDESVNEWSAIHGYIAKGFLYPFIHGVKDTLRELRGANPDWYDEQDAKELLESYVSVDIPVDKRVNIIVMLLESYADLSTLNVLDFKEDIYDPLHRLQMESFSGTLINNTFSGGTIDTERLFLTGNTRLTPFTSPTNSFVHYIKSQGYHTEGLHAGDLWFYDRRPVNSHLGFENYYFLEDYENSNRYDWFFFPTLTELYYARDINKPYFSFNLSYQNHGPYDSQKTQEPYLIERNGLSDESFNIINNYLLGISDTTKRFDRFIDSLRDDTEPVVVLIFGDHMPWLGNLNSAYLELGINIDKETEEGFYNYFSTPYVIWANDAAKKMLGNDFTGVGDSISPCFLMGELFRLCSWEGEGYMQALRELKTRIDIINPPSGWFRESGNLRGKLSPEGEDALMKVNMMELYRRRNFAY